MTKPIEVGSIDPGPAGFGDCLERAPANVDTFFDALGNRPPSPATGQSRRGSLIETITSTAIGFAVSLVLTAVVMPAFGYPTTWAHDFWITVIFTVASIVRGYCVRRLFESLR